MNWQNPDDETVIDLLSRVRSIVVVGLSPKPARDSHSVSAYMQRQGYRITGVNPGHRTILGEPCYPSLAEVPADRPLELVNFFRNAALVGRDMEAAVSAGARALWTQYDVIDEEAARRATDAGVLVIMDRCILVEHRRLIGGGR
ncbi:MAG TPA: CoA-binding protein [Candidatus Eisenbacteria bacterium]